MSALKIKLALEGAISAISTAMPTRWENVDFSSVAGQPFQSVIFNFLPPDNPTMGPTFYVERGVVSIYLHYPIKAGSGAAMARAELIKSSFLRGSTYSNGGVTCQIDNTPEIMAGYISGDRYILPVRVRFTALI